MKREYALDILRIYCCYCIIMLHVSGQLNNNGNFWRLVQGVVRPTLWCFMMLSGYFILSRSITKWSKFYFTHIIHLIVPLVVYTFVYQLYYSGGKSISLKSIIAGDSIGHLWFVYNLIALYILASFLQKMLMNLSDIQLTGLLITMFFFGRVINIIAKIGVSIGIPTGILGSCSLFFFVLGYWIYRMNINIDYKCGIVLWIINTIYCVYAFSNPILADGVANLSLSMVIGVVVYYVLFSGIFSNIKESVITKMIIFISSRTYGIYLIHMLIFQYFSNHNIMSLIFISYMHCICLLILKCLCIFVIGLIFATIMDLLICDPIQKVCNYFCDKIVRVVER